MPIQVAANLIPKAGFKWPVLEDIYVKGGLRVVASVAARDAIYLDINARSGLKTGMLLITASDSEIWQYAGGGVWAKYRPGMYTHNQNTVSTIWHVTHNKGSASFTYAVFSSAGMQIVPEEVHIIDNNNLEITFLEGLSGTVTFNFN